MTSPVDVAKLRALCDEHNEQWCCMCGCTPAGPDITYARGALAACLDEIERLRTEADKIHADRVRLADDQRLLRSQLAAADERFVTVQQDNDALRAALTEALDIADRFLVEDPYPNQGTLSIRLAELRKLLEVTP